MKTRHLIAAIAIVGASAGPLAADATHDRVVAYGFAPAQIQPSTVVERETREARSLTEQRLVEWGYKRPDSTVVARYTFERLDRETELTQNEARLRDFGYRSWELSYRAGPEVADGEHFLGDLSGGDVR
ncbi:hypothetical protein [Aquisalimonas sp.]|uniref:hypothetical protein n=1 Tax=Aquisalimonas sp. TaxID=1872621 RepID=UPI0025C1DED7|nr:hypothetical protein [Aquisalimonas sp.]